MLPQPRHAIITPRRPTVNPPPSPPHSLSDTPLPSGAQVGALRALHAEQMGGAEAEAADALAALDREARRLRAEFADAQSALEADKAEVELRWAAERSKAQRLAEDLAVRRGRAEEGWGGGGRMGGGSRRDGLRARGEGRSLGLL